MTFVRISEDVARKVALGLMQIRAVELRPDEPFTWSSGWKSPIYCDNRLILSYPALRDIVIAGLTEAVSTYFPGVQVLAGTATAGIPHAAFAAYELGLPMAYVRSSAKSHGKGRKIEGLVRPGDKVVVVEDTISTGSSAFDAVRALREDGADVIGVLSIFSYDFQVATDAAADLNVQVCRLLDYDELIAAATWHGYISEKDRARLLDWRQHPDSYRV